MKTYELMVMIRNKDLVLPEFQREYVWSREQAKKLIDSLLKEFPVGALLFWKTSHPPELKNVDRLPDKLGTVHVILDGQQRLTTLYLLMMNAIPPYYREVDITMDPRDLYYNLETGELQYYQPSRMKKSPLWQRVVDCFSKNSQINIFEIAQGMANDSTSAFDIAQRLNANLNRLLRIRDIDLQVLNVPPDASLEEAVDIFDRVNSQGTKLTDAELALTHVTSKWPEARRLMKKKRDELAKKLFAFDLTFMTRALTAVVCKRALFETIHPVQRPDLEKGWEDLSKILDYLVTMLPGRAFIHSTEDLNSTNILIPWVAYLAVNGKRFPDDKVLAHAVYWLYSAHIWARYTAQTDQRLEQDVNIILREAMPWSALVEQIIDQRGRIEVKASDFEGREAQHPLYRMAFIMAKAHGAVDWFNGLPLGSHHGNSYRLHSHHIFPQSVLYRNGYTPDNHLHRKVVNEIANRAFLTQETNQEISNRLPEEYLPEVEARFPGALSKQFIPMDPLLWRLDRYEDFLAARRELLARKINEYMNALIREPVPVGERPITELIRIGEGPTLEFKSTLQWDVIQNQPNKALRLSVLKTIAAFLNSQGGTLIIGVEDNGDIYGLERDLSLLEESRDKFQQLLSSLIVEYIGAGIIPLCRIRLEEVQESLICVIEVDRASHPVYLKGEKGAEFYVRFGTTTRALDPEQTTAYIESNWG